MSRKMSKLELLQEFRYTEKAKEVTDMVDLERKMKAYARQNDITVRSYNKDYQENDVASGALFRIICLVIAVAASIGIFKGDLGWPIGIKLVVIAVIWVVLKDQVL